MDERAAFFNHTKAKEVRVIVSVAAADGQERIVLGDERCKVLSTMGVLRLQYGSAVELLFPVPGPTALTTALRKPIFGKGLPAHAAPLGRRKIDDLRRMGNGFDPRPFRTEAELITVFECLSVRSRPRLLCVSKSFHVGALKADFRDRNRDVITLDGRLIRVQVSPNDPRMGARGGFVVKINLHDPPERHEHYLCFLYQGLLSIDIEDTEARHARATVGTIDAANFQQLAEFRKDLMPEASVSRRNTMGQQAPHQSSERGQPEFQEDLKPLPSKANVPVFEGRQHSQPGCGCVVS